MKPSRDGAVEGTRRLRDLVRAQGRATVARKCRTTEDAVRHWTMDRRRPSADARILLLREYEIPLEAWDCPAPPAPKPAPARATPGLALAGPSPPRAPLAAPPKDESVKEKARRQIVRLEGEIARCEALCDVETEAHARSLLSKERATLEGVYMQALSRFSKLTGESELSEAHILRSHAWNKVMRTLVEAITPWPDAARAISIALDLLSEVGVPR